MIDLEAVEDRIVKAWEAGAEAMQKKIAKEFAKAGFKAEASFVLTSSLPTPSFDAKLKELL